VRLRDKLRDTGLHRFSVRLLPRPRAGGADHRAGCACPARGGSASAGRGEGAGVRDDAGGSARQGGAVGPLTLDMGLRIEKAFGVPMDTLAWMQNSFDIAQARKRESEIEVPPFTPTPPADPHLNCCDNAGRFRN